MHMNCVTCVRVWRVDFVHNHTCDMGACNHTLGMSACNALVFFNWHGYMHAQRPLECT